MYNVIYNIAIYFYQGLIFLAALFKPKAKLWLDGRKDWKQKLEKATKGQNNIYWFHAASLGEFEQGRPLIEKINAEQNNVFILLTFFSPSGYEIRKDYSGADYICYLPSDTKKNSEEFISIAQPKQVFFIKYEFWYNYMKVLKEQNIPLYLISGIFRDKHIFFKGYGAWFRKQLQAFTYFYLQDQFSIDKLKSIGYENALLVGDTRFDRVIEIAEQVQPINIVEDFVAQKPCLVIGSSWINDEEILAKYINNNSSNKYVLAPHEIDSSHLETLENLLKVPSQRFSDFRKNANIDAVVLIIDNIGMLSSIYQYADVAYIGGAFKTGLHNILEAAVYGMPVVFGPKYSKFQEAKDLIEEQAVLSISSYEELSLVLDTYLSHKTKSNAFAQKAKSFIYKSKGAVNLIYVDVFS